MRTSVSVASGTASRTSSRVMPARHAVASDGVSSRPSRTTKTLEPVPSLSRPRRRRRSPRWRRPRGPGPGPRRSRRRTSTSPRPARRVGLRVKGTVATGAAAGHTAGRPRRPAARWPRRCRARCRAGPGPPVTVSRSRPRRPPPPRRREITAVQAERELVVGQPDVEGKGRRRGPQAAEVAGEGEGRPVDHLHRLEHAVAHRQPVIGDRHPGVHGRSHHTVEPTPGRHGRNPRVSPCTSSSPMSRRRSARSSATSPRPRSRPHAEAWDRDHTFPVDVVLAMGELGPVRHPLPRGVRRRRRRPHHALHRHRGARPGRPVDGHHPRGRRRPRRQPDLPRSAPRSRSSAGCPTCAPAGRSAASASPSPRPGSDAGGTRTTAPCSTRPPASGSSTARRRSSPTRAPTSRRSSPSPPAPTAGGGGEISTIIVPAGTPGLRGAAAVPEDGLARLRHPRADLRRLPRARGQPARRAGPGLRPVPRRSSTTAASPSPPWPSACIQACLEHCVAVRQGPQRLRQAHRRQPGASPSSAPTWP